MDAPQGRSVSPARHRIGTLALAFVLVSGCVYTTLHQDRWGYDDAYISYRYAENLIEGRGLVFNPGERVEGYSNLLYVLAMAVGQWLLPRDAIYGFSVACNVACLLAALAVLLSIVRTRCGEAAAWLAGGLFALSPPLWRAAWSGMESCLVVLLVVALWAAVRRIEAGDRRSVALVALLPLLVLCRADGFVMALVTAVYFALHREPWFAALTGLVGAGTALLQAGARLLYYGDALPNTYYVKVASPLSERLAFAFTQLLGFIELQVLLLMLAGLAFERGVRQRSARAALDFPTFFAGSWLAYWLYVGGDVFGMRLLLGLLPLCFAAAAELAARFFAANRPGRALAAGWLALLAALPFWTDELGGRRMRYDPWMTLGRFLGARHPEQLIAVDGAGKVPYYSRLRAIDMLGLTDAHVAHTAAHLHLPGHGKYDADYIFERSPDLIAAWVSTRRFDLAWGLDAPRYRREGYRLAYLLSLSSDPGGPTVVAVRDRPPAERRALLDREYRYAVLERERRPR